jgi:hypothetical protein
MAAHPLTGVDRDSDRFVVRLASTNQIINHNALWPVLDGGPIEGGNVDWKYYKKVDQPSPPMDHRYYPVTVNSFTDTTPAPAVGYPSGTFGGVTTAVKRPLETLLAQIESEFQRQVRLQFPDTENPATLLLAAKALAKRQTGAVLTADETASLDAVTAVGDAVDQLVARRQELIDAATAGDDYDLTVWPALS